MSGSTDWSDLPGDVWFAVGLRLDAASDRIRFRAVSKSLRSHLPFRHPPWLMLSEIDQDSNSHYSDSDSDFDEDEEVDVSEEENEVDSALPPPPPPPPPRRRFVILGEQRIYEFDLPQVYQARCIGSTNTWLTISKTDPTVITLLNPFTKLELHLPSQTTFVHKIFFEMEIFPPLNSVMDTILHKAIIYPSSNGNDFLVIAVERQGILAMARPGDLFWSTLNVESKLHTGVMDMVVFQQTLFAVNIHGLLLSCDIQNYPNPNSLSVVGQPFDKFKLHPFSYNDPHSFEMVYLVECCGHLLLVIKFINMIEIHLLCGRIPVPNYKTERFHVYRFDFTFGNWIEISSLGEYSLFLGKNTSVSVLASEFFGLVKKNCIYFTDDFHFGYHGTLMPGRFVAGVFDLDDNSISPNYQVTNYQATSTGSTPPPIWIVPN